MIKNGAGKYSVSSRIEGILSCTGRLTNRLPLRVPRTAALVLIGTGLLLMRAVDADSEWTTLLVGGLATGIISPALAAAMVSVLPVERSGLASGINNTFRQLGIAMGIAGLGAIFEHRASKTLGLRAGIGAGLDSVRGRGGRRFRRCTPCLAAARETAPKRLISQNCDPIETRGACGTWP
jgi:MFS family permease